MGTCMNSIIRQGKTEHGVTGSSSQASFYRSIPSTNLYTFFTSILSSGLQTALSDAILTHSLSLRPPPPLLVTVSDSDIHVATAHIYT